MSILCITDTYTHNNSNKYLNYKMNRKKKMNMTEVLKIKKWYVNTYNISIIYKQNRRHKIY